MIKNYIILAHRHPKQLYRMIEKLQDENSHFYIHLDLKNSMEDFEFLNELQNVKFIKERINCIWGDFSIVRATLELIHNVINDGNEGFTILLSGQDYPLKSNSYITDFLKQNSTKNFIDILPIEEKWGKKMVKDKIENYHILHSESRSNSNCYAPFYSGNLKSKFRTVLHLAKGRLSSENFKFLKTLPKRIPLFEKQYAGSQWWALNWETLKTMKAYIDENFSSLEAYYSYTSSPDELFFQTVLMHVFSGEIENFNPSLTYVNWERKGCSLPVTFTASDFNELAQKPHLFARKFDTEISSQLLNKIDSDLLNH